MPVTIFFGSIGSNVSQLQSALNQLAPTGLPRLVVDGMFGALTLGRVKEFQDLNDLVPDGIVGPLTWAKLAELLNLVAKGGIPVTPGVNKSTFDLLRPLVLIIAQQHMGRVDFSVMENGKPKGLKFLIDMFAFAANQTLTEANFRKNGGTGDWTWTPWIGLPTQYKSWCGVFAVYCYRMAGIPITWDLGGGGPIGPVKLATFSNNYAAGILPADIGSVATQSHHFLIESIGSGKTPSMTSIDGNTDYGRIQRKETHKVGLDNFNHYEFKG